MNKCLSAAVGVILLAGIFWFYPDKEQKFTEIVRNKNFQVGVAVLAEDGLKVSDNDLYPLASVFKLHVAAAVLNKVEEDKISLDYELPVKQRGLIANTHSPMLDGRGNGDFFLSLKELLRYMLAYSDNNACDILISFAGGMDYIQAYVKNLGFDNTILRVTEKEMQDNPEKQKINQATPADVSRFLALILREGFFMPAHRSFVQETLMQTNTGEDKIKRFLPPDVVMGHKTGTGMRTADGMRIAENDAAFVRLPDGREYYLVILLKNSYESDETNRLAIAEIANAVYQQFKQ